MCLSETGYDNWGLSRDLNSSQIITVQARIHQWILHLGLDGRGCVYFGRFNKSKTCCLKRLSFNKTVIHTQDILGCHSGLQPVVSSLEVQ